MRAFCISAFPDIRLKFAHRQRKILLCEEVEPLKIKHTEPRRIGNIPLAVAENRVKLDVARCMSASLGLSAHVARRQHKRRKKRIHKRRFSDSRCSRERRRSADDLLVYVFFYGLDTLARMAAENEHVVSRERVNFPHFFGVFLVKFAFFNDNDGFNLIKFKYRQQFIHRFGNGFG